MQVLRHKPALILVLTVKQMKKVIMKIRMNDSTLNRC